MAKEKGPTLSQKSYLNDRLLNLFAKARTTLNDRASTRRIEVQRQVFKEAGFSGVEEQARKLMQQIDEINAQYRNICGRSLVDFNIRPVQFHEISGSGLLGRKVDELLGETTEGLQLQRLAAYQQELGDKINLSAGEGLDLMAILNEAQGKIDEIVGIKKALPASTDTKEE